MTPSHPVSSRAHARDLHYKQKSKDYFVYAVTNWTNEVMYIGMTNNLERRLAEHKSGQVKGFSSKYKTTKLVYFEQFNDVEIAILREKEIKKWRREKKDKLVKTTNPEWNDLSERYF